MSHISLVVRDCAQNRRQLDVPRYQRKTLGRLAFSVAEPTVWNSLPDELRDETEKTFWQLPKTLFFRQRIRGS